MMKVVIKSLDELLKTAAEFVGNIINPAAKETGLLVAESIRSWRLKNQVNILTKAERYMRKKNMTMRTVSVKMIAPLLEQCSLEEDAGLQQKWTALLINTVKEDSTVNTSLYSSTLNQLSSEEARLFEYLYYISDFEVTEGQQPSIITIDGGKISIARLFEPAGAYREFEDLDILLDNLKRLRLVAEIQNGGNGMETICISSLGTRFYGLCHLQDEEKMD